ncbi:MAG: hypothetical protein Fur003_3580 [Candidatus Dojkabacteria bacterium]
MNKLLLSALFVSATITIIFGYFFYRDVYTEVLAGQKELTCVPTDLKKANDEKKVTMQWRAANECKSYVVYGESPDDAEFIALPKKDKNGYMAVEIDELKKGYTYYFYVYSEGQIYGYRGGPIVVKTPSTSL